ncbi:MAG: YkgJ family cysteine cluster protein [Phycisphaerales bacterium]|nr:YkgJ family cysteine cluster protein [Phycisphaerales bacterium]
MTSDIGEIAASHKATPALADSMRRFYADVDAAIADRAPVCTNRGLCCNFGAYDHDLFVTTIELAYFIAGHGDAWRSPPAHEKRCPYQIDGVCTAREHRPLGCRLFFCDASSTAWQHAEYEKRIARLKEMGAATGVEYRYVEWLSALASTPASSIRPIPGPVDTGASPEFVDRQSLPVIESE